MSKPTYMTGANPPFVEHLATAEKEITKRVQARPTHQANQTRAQLWVRWIIRNLLADTTGKAGVA